MPGATRLADACAQKLEGPVEIFRTGVFEPGDRRMRLTNTSVSAWNVYAGGNGRLRVSDSTLGEAWGLEGNGLLTVADSLIDGTGGFLSARGGAVVDVINTSLTTRANAADDGYLRIRTQDGGGAVIDGSVEAGGRAALCLEGVEVRGPVSVTRPGPGDSATVTLAGDTTIQGPQTGPAGSIVEAGCPPPPIAPLPQSNP